jgi:maleamate amidohydrolase
MSASGSPTSAPRVGAGAHPALLVVDLQRGWTDGDSAFALPLAQELAATAALLEMARAGGVPVIYTTVCYDEVEVASLPMLLKAPRVAAMQAGSWLVEIDPRVAPLDGERVIGKKHASAFFGTPLASHVIASRIDSVLIAGCITSGCVRATAVDAAQHGLRALVVADAVGDRSLEDHTASLRSIDALYGDVISLAEAQEVLEGVGRQRPRRSASP